MTAYGNTLPTLDTNSLSNATDLGLLLANFGAVVCDYVARQKIRSRHLNKYIIEQLPIIPVNKYDTVWFGRQTAREVINPLVLELTYTAHDMAPFARDMEYVDEAGEVKPPFILDEWSLILRAKLDAAYFHLYGITDRDDGALYLFDFSYC